MKLEYLLFSLFFLMCETTSARYISFDSFSFMEKDNKLGTQDSISCSPARDNRDINKDNGKQSDDNTFFPIVDIEPEFPGGVKSLMEFISGNLRYPAYAADNGIQGKVTLIFVVEKDGTITNIQELSSPSEDLTREAMRVVQSMPRWKPGILDGKAVPVRFMIPITFRLDSGNTVSNHDKLEKDKKQ